MGGCKSKPKATPRKGSGSAVATASGSGSAAPVTTPLPPSMGPAIAPAIADATTLASLSGAERFHVCNDLMVVRPDPAMQAQVACRAAAVGQTPPGPDAGAKCRAAFAACIAAPPPAIARPPCLPPEVTIPAPPACATSTMADLRGCVLEIAASAQRVVGSDVCATFDSLPPVAGATGPDTRATDAFIAANMPSATCQAVRECSRLLLEPPHPGP